MISGSMKSATFFPSQISGMTSYFSSGLCKSQFSAMLKIFFAKHQPNIDHACPMTNRLFSNNSCEIIQAHPSLTLQVKDVFISHLFLDLSFQFSFRLALHFHQLFPFQNGLRDTGRPVLQKGNRAVVRKNGCVQVARSPPNNGVPPIHDGDIGEGCRYRA